MQSNIQPQTFEGTRDNFNNAFRVLKIMPPDIKVSSVSICPFGRTVVPRIADSANQYKSITRRTFCPVIDTMPLVINYRTFLSGKQDIFGINYRTILSGIDTQLINTSGNPIKLLGVLISVNLLY